jgi:hypothetical protein
MHLDSATARDHAAEYAARMRAAAVRATADATARTTSQAPRLIVQPEGLAFRPQRAAAIAIKPPAPHWTSVAARVPASGRPLDGWPDPTRLPVVTA